MVGIRAADLGDGRRNSFINILTIGNFLKLDVNVQSGKFVIQNLRTRERLLSILAGEKEYACGEYRYKTGKSADHPQIRPSENRRLFFLERQNRPAASGREAGLRLD